jgi:flagellar basal-body rod protein FlgB
VIDRLFNPLERLERGLDAAWQKNTVIANNIANIDTPGFKAATVDFETIFRDNLSDDKNAKNEPTQSAVFAGTASRNEALRHKSLAEGERFSVPVTEKSNTSIRMDDNNVDVDAEMAAAAENAIVYDTLSYAASKELGRLRMIINGGN